MIGWLAKQWRKSLQNLRGELANKCWLSLKKNSYSYIEEWWESLKKHDNVGFKRLVNHPEEWWERKHKYKL